MYCYEALSTIRASTLMATAWHIWRPEWPRSARNNGFALLEAVAGHVCIRRRSPVREAWKIAICLKRAWVLLREIANVMLIRVNHQFKAIAHAELVKCGSQVVPDRHITNGQAFGDLFVF